VKTLFFFATCLRNHSSSRSDLGLPKSSGFSWRRIFGTVWSMSSSRSFTPSTLNISCISAGEGPMWRRLAKSYGR